jgi:predicted metal-dependent TIM-barrel fold hydrolase
MKFIDPHIHMSARSTDDYEAMAAAGIVAVIEPAFWLGQPRTNVGSFIDYYSSLVGWERYRAAQFGIQHYCTIGLNSKESNNEPLAEAVMEILPRFLCKERVVALGEIGYDEMSALEEHYFSKQLALAAELELLVMIHTPHRNKWEGTLRSMDLCIDHGLDPSRVIIDHNNEQTVKEVLDRGFWAAFTLYPKTKMNKMRMVDIVKTYGSERIIVDSSADWGVSNPLAVPQTAALMAENGIQTQDIEKTCYQNAISAYGQSGQFNPEDWEGQKIDQSTLFEGNSVLRGQTPTIEE